MKIYYISYNKKKCNRRILQKMYLSLLVCFYGIQTNANTDKALDKIDRSCEEIVRTGQRIGYWVCTFMCLYEIIKNLKNGNVNAIWGIIVKYSIAYGGVFIIRFALDMIGEWFS